MFSFLQKTEGVPGRHKKSPLLILLLLPIKVIKHIDPLIIIEPLHIDDIDPLTCNSILFSPTTTAIG